MWCVCVRACGQQISSRWNRTEGERETFGSSLEMGLVNGCAITGIDDDNFIHSPSRLDTGSRFSRSGRRRRRNRFGNTRYELDGDYENEETAPEVRKVLFPTASSDRTGHAFPHRRRGGRSKCATSLKRGRLQILTRHSRSAFGIFELTEMEFRWTRRRRAADMFLCGGREVPSSGESPHVSVSIGTVESVTSCFEDHLPDRAFSVSFKYGPPIRLRATSARECASWKVALQCAIAKTSIRDVNALLPPLLFLEKSPHTIQGSSVMSPSFSSPSVSLLDDRFWCDIVGMGGKSARRSKERIASRGPWKQATRTTRIPRWASWLRKASKTRSRIMKNHHELSVCLKVLHKARAMLVFVITQYIDESDLVRRVMNEVARYVGELRIHDVLNMWMRGNDANVMCRQRWESEMRKIDRDVGRTFNGSLSLSSSSEKMMERSLRRVLSAAIALSSIVQACPSSPFEYSQGVNLVGGLVMLAFHSARRSFRDVCGFSMSHGLCEEVAFWIIVRIYDIASLEERITSRNWLSFAARKPSSACTLFDAIIRNRFPRLRTHFDQIGVPTIMFSPAIVNALFIEYGVAGWNLALAAIDMILAGVDDVPLRLGIATIRHYESELLRMANESNVLLLTTASHLLRLLKQVDVAPIVCEALSIEGISFQLAKRPGDWDLSSP